MSKAPTHTIDELLAIILNADYEKLGSIMILVQEEKHRYKDMFAYSRLLIAISKRLIEFSRQKVHRIDFKTYKYEQLMGKFRY